MAAARATSSLSCAAAALLARGVTAAAARGRQCFSSRRIMLQTSPAPAAQGGAAAAADGLARRLVDEELARKEEARNARRARVISNALALIRQHGAGTDKEAHRKALLTLGGYAPHLAPDDAVLVVRQALEMGQLKHVAFAVLEELRRMDGGQDALLREADALVAAACRKGHHRMAVMVVEDVQQRRVRFPPADGRRQRGGGMDDWEGAGQAAPAAAPSYISRSSYVSLLRRLREKGRHKSHWRLAASLITYKGRPAAAVLAGDVEAVALAMQICWRAGKWRSVQRLLDCLVEAGGLPVPPGGGAVLGTGGGVQVETAEAGLQRMEALFAALRRAAATAATTDHCNMLLLARLKAGRRAEAVALVEEMLAGGTAATTTAPAGPAGALPRADALSVCLVLEALGGAGEWAACLGLLQRAREALPPLDKAGMAMVYKTAIAAAGKAGLWEGCISLFYELHERGLPTEVSAYTALFKALRTAGRLDALRAFLEGMPAQNVAPDRAAYNVLFAALGKEGLVTEALACFERMQAEQGLQATPYDYGTLIAACGQAVERLPDLNKTEMKIGEVEAEKERLVGLARRLLGQAAEGAAKRATAGTDGGMGNCFMQVLKVLGKAGRADEARALLAEMQEAGVPPTFGHYYEAQRAAAFAGDTATALGLLEEYRAATGKQPHIINWNAAFLACSLAGDADGCLALLGRMRSQGAVPGAFQYARAVGALGRAGRWGEAFELLKEDPGVLDPAVYGAMLAAAGEAGEAEVVGKVLGAMRAAGVPGDALTVAHAVAALARGCGRWGEAEALLLRGVGGEGEGAVGGGAPSRLAYHALMLAAIEQGQAAGERCAALLSGMVERHGLCPTPVTHALLARARCGPEALALAKALYAPVRFSLAPGEEEETEVMKEVVGEVSFETARAAVEKALGLNPHVTRHRVLCVARSDL